MRIYRDCNPMRPAWCGWVKLNVRRAYAGRIASRGWFGGGSMARAVQDPFHLFSTARRLEFRYSKKTRSWFDVVFIQICVCASYGNAQDAGGPGENERNFNLFCIFQQLLMKETGFALPPVCHTSNRMDARSHTHTTTRTLPHTHTLSHLTHLASSFLCLCVASFVIGKRLQRIATSSTTLNPPHFNSIQVINHKSLWNLLLHTCIHAYMYAWVSSVCLQRAGTPIPSGREVEWLINDSENCDWKSHLQARGWPGFRPRWHCNMHCSMGSQP